MRRVITVAVLLAWVAVLGMVIVIFSFSSQGGAESVGISERIVDSLIERLNLGETIKSNEWFLEHRNYIFRKIMHFLEYGLLAVLIFNAVRLLKLRWWKVAGLTLLLAVVTAMFDEFYQSSVPGRSPKVLDVLIDSMGALTAIMLCLLFRGLVRLAVRR
ncbi:MAG: VanZ family protein [Bacillota bacterium]